MVVYSALGIVNAAKYEPIGVFSEIPDEEALKQLIKETDGKDGDNA